MAKKLTEEEYDRRIAAHGRVVRIEPYKNSKTKIKHKCIIHGLESYASPHSILVGHGLTCCSSYKLSNEKCKENFDNQLLAIGKVKRVGEYVDMKTKILFLCLQHQEIHLATPGPILRGQGLYCCSSGKEKSRKAKLAFDEKVKKLGRVERVGEYIDSNTKILFRCLEHGKIHLSSPHSILRGSGLACCNTGKVSNKRLKDEFDNRIAALGRVKRLGNFVDVNTKIEFLCLQHNQIYLAKPSDILQGCGLACCKRYNCQNLLNLLTNDTKSLDACVYLYRLNNYQGHFKLGISSQLHIRSRDEQYGDFITSFHTDSRLEAYCVEQAALRDVLIRRSCPDELRISNWPGYTEVISCSEETATNVIQFYWDLVQELGPYQFALDYLNPTEEERQLLDERLAMLS